MISDRQAKAYLSEKVRSLNECLILNRKNQANIKDLIESLTAQLSKLQSFIESLNQIHSNSRRNAAEFYAYNLPVTTRSPLISLFRKIKAKGGVAGENGDPDFLAPGNEQDSFSMSCFEIDEDEESQSEFEWSFIRNRKQSEDFQDYDNYQYTKKASNEFHGFGFAEDSANKMDSNQLTFKTNDSSAKIVLKMPTSKFKRISKRPQVKSQTKTLDKLDSKAKALSPIFSQKMLIRSDQDSLEGQDTVSNQSKLFELGELQKKADVFAAVSLKIERLLTHNLPKILESFKINLAQPLCIVDFRELANELNTSKFLATVEAPVYPVNIYRVLRKAQNQKPEKREWSQPELEILKRLVDRFGISNWKQVSVFLPGRSFDECRKQYSLAIEAKYWEPFGDVRLIIGVIAFDKIWVEISNRLFMRSKSEMQCRERYENLLNPCIFGSNSDKSEMFQIVVHRLQGKRWAWISKNVLPHRTDNKIFRLYQYFRRNYKKLFFEIKRALSAATALEFSNMNGISSRSVFKVQRLDQ